MWTKEDKSFKNLLNYETTDSDNKNLFNERGADTINAHADHLWSDTIAFNDPAAAIVSGAAEAKTLFSLIEDLTVRNHQCWKAVLSDWISPKYGMLFTVRLFDGTNAEIFPTDELNWIFDYQTGILTFNGVFSRTTPLKVTGYRYIGAKGVPSGVTQYATEVALLAATPADSTIGYAQDTDKYWFRANGIWMAQVTSSGGTTFTTTDITIPVDPASTLVVGSGVLFTNQTELNSYLIAQGATAFKYIQDVWEHLPEYLMHNIYFSCAPGVHRPRNPETAPAPWFFGVYGTFPRFILPGKKIGIVSSVAYNYSQWEVIAASQPVTAFSNASYNPYADVSGTPYTPGALKGYFAWFNSDSRVRVIRDNTASRLSLVENISGTPTTVTIVSPSVILRNSYNDTTAAMNTSMIVARNEYHDLQISNFVLDGLRLDQFATYQRAVESRGTLQCDWTYLLVDLARWRNLGVNITSHGLYVLNGNFNGFAYDISFRGRGIATIPASDSSTVAFEMWNGVAPASQGRMVIRYCYFGGFGAGIECDGQHSVEVFGCQFDTLSGGFGAIWLNETNLTLGSGYIHNTAKNCASFALRLQSTCGVSVNGPFIVEGCYGGIQVDGRFNKLYFEETSGTVAGFINGSIPNTYYGILFSEVRRTDNFVRMGPAHNVTGASGDILINNSWDGLTGSEIITYAYLAGLRTIETQPSGTLQDVVLVRDIQAGTAIGNGTLTYLNAGTTLAFTAFGDTIGPAINVSAGGWFTLKSNNGKFVIVYVVLPLPVGNSTQTFRITRGKKEFFNANILEKWS